jgi:hypothetical protein
MQLPVGVGVGPETGRVSVNRIANAGTNNIVNGQQFGAIILALSVIIMRWHFELFPDQVGQVSYVVEDASISSETAPSQAA